MKYFSNGEEIKSNHINIAIELFAWLDKCRESQKSMPITYGKLAEKVGLNQRGLGPYLGALSTECNEHGLPLISAIVVHKDTQMPAPQFWEMASRNGRGDINIDDEKQRVFNQKDWQLLKNRLGLE